MAQMPSSQSQVQGDVHIHVHAVRGNHCVTFIFSGDIIDQRSNAHDADMLNQSAGLKFREKRPVWRAKMLPPRPV